MYIEMTLYNGDCFDMFGKIEKRKVDLVLVDLPYGQTVCEWDTPINLSKMWRELERICKHNAVYVFFTTTKYGVELINSKKSFFRYDLVYEKYNSVGFLLAKNQPLRVHEMIYIFSCPNSDDIDVKYNTELREYARRVHEYIGKPYSEIKKDRGDNRLQHFIGSYKTTQFTKPTEKTYNDLIERYSIDKMDGFIPYDKLPLVNPSNRKTYNPQMTQGKPYKTTRTGKPAIYGGAPNTATNNIGDRYPKSVLKYHQSGEKLHPTQKPVDLCEWLIRTYSNKGDTVLDFCMGSGSTIIACINTERQYIGIEKDKDIFKVAKKRIEKHEDSLEHIEK